MFNYHFHYVGFCLMQADDLFQEVLVEGTTKGPRPIKYDSGFGSEPTSKTQEPGAHLQQLHQQPPDPGIQEGGTSDEEYDKLRQATPYDPEWSELVPGRTWPFCKAGDSTDQLVVASFDYRARLELVERPNVWHCATLKDS